MALHENVTGVIIAAFHTVYNRLGAGFLENVYVGALEHELRKRGLRVAREVPIAVWYDGVIVGTYRGDLLVENCVLIEAKSTEKPHGRHVHKLIHYLRSTEVEVGLALYFGDRPEVKRFIYTNDRKRELARNAEASA